MVYTVLYCTQSRQSAKISLQSSELGLPHPITPQASVAPPPLVRGGRGILAGERGGGRVLISTRGHTLWYSIYMCTLWYTYLQTQYVGDTDGVLQYRIPSSSEETVYCTSSGLYPALSLEEAGNRAGGHVSPPSPYTSHPLASRRRHSFLPNFDL